MANAKITDWNITLDQLVEQIGEEVRGSMDKYFDFLQKQVSTHPFSGTKPVEETKDAARKNIIIAREYAHKMSRAKDLLEHVNTQTEFSAVAVYSIARAKSASSALIPRQRQKCSTRR